MFAINSEELEHTFEFVPYEPNEPIMLTNRVITLDGVRYEYGFTAYYVLTTKSWSVVGWAYEVEGSEVGSKIVTKAPDSVTRKITHELERGFSEYEETQYAYFDECADNEVDEGYLRHFAFDFDMIDSLN